jgi:hypothetical protein
MFCSFLLPLKEEQRIAFVHKLLEWAPALSLSPSFTFGSKDGSNKHDMTNIKNATLRFQYSSK